MAELIKQLSEFVSNQIAAGEVVLRPGSVVKELMENSVDAGSELIIVNISGGGGDFIQVVDDGIGIDFNDAIKAFNRHATSKISDINDLFALNTFGFRGEALPSIASVAEVEMKSRREEDELGVRVQINGGQLIDHSNAVCSKGTQFMVKNLFYNIPARRKFMKSPQAEQRNIEAEFMRIALCYPKITFFLYSNDKCIYNLPASNLRQRVNGVIGKASGANLMELFIDTSIVEIKGYIGNPRGAKKSAEQFFFVNGRYFKHHGLHKAVQIAYQKLLPSMEVMPPYFLYLTIDPQNIDVNINPSKTEVKFDDESSIWQILNAAVRESLGKNGIVPMIDFESGSAIDIPIFSSDADFKEPQIDVNPSFNPFDDSFSFSRAVAGGGDSFRNVIKASSENTDYEEISSSLSSHSGLVRDSYIEIESSFQSEEFIIIESQANEPKLIEDSELAIEVGGMFTIKDRYIVTYVNGRVLFVDAVRAMDRILFETYMDKIKGQGKVTTQRMIFEISITLSMIDFPIIVDSIDDLRDMGFELTTDSNNCTITVTGIPSDIKAEDTEALFEEIIASLKEGEIESYLSSRREKVVHSLSKVSSRSTCSFLNKEKMEYIIKSLLLCRDSNYTPDGRSIYMAVSSEDITVSLETN